MVLSYCVLALPSSDHCAPLSKTAQDGDKPDLTLRRWRRFLAGASVAPGEAPSRLSSRAPYSPNPW